MTRANKLINIRALTLIPLFTALTIVGAFFKIHTPWGVPLSLQFFFALCSGMLLGPWMGAAAQLLYIALGLAGLPVFTGGGGIGYVLQPTFGFIIGFVLSSFTAGLLADKIISSSADKKRRWLMLFLAGVAAMVVCHLTGALHMFALRNFYLDKPITFAKVLLAASVPFLPTDTLWSAVAAGLAVRLSLLRKNAGRA